MCSVAELEITYWGGYLIFKFLHFYAWFRHFIEHHMLSFSLLLFFYIFLFFFNCGIKNSNYLYKNSFILPQRGAFIVAMRGLDKDLWGIIKNSIYYYIQKKVVKESRGALAYTSPPRFAPVCVANVCGTLAAGLLSISQIFQVNLINFFKFNYN